jgi:imidazole glycerol phosphate synthase subunit HisF
MFHYIADTGDPVELAKIFGEGADELVFLDISATKKKEDLKFGT